MSLDDDDGTDQPARPFEPTTSGIGEESSGIDKDWMSPQRESAMYYHVLFSDFIEAGFSEDQALHLTGVAIAKQMEINAMLANLRRMRGERDG
jgi:hypothetical protein